MSKQRLEIERKFHDHRFADNDSIRTNIKKYYVINNIALKKYYDIIYTNCKNKKLLEYGCGTGDNIKIFNSFNAHVTGIDISQEGINKANKKIMTNKLDADCYVMDAENTDFKNNSFDIIAGRGIIHHLNIEKIYSETSRILNQHGHAVFMEPLGHNPLINLYRKLTPNIRTPDEHPLIRKDLKLLKKYFYDVDIQYFSLLTLITVPFRNSFIFNLLFKTLCLIDRIILGIPFIRDLAWIAVIHASKPIK